MRQVQKDFYPHNKNEMREDFVKSISSIAREDTYTEKTSKKRLEDLRR